MYKGFYFEDVRSGYGELLLGEVLLFKGGWENGKRVEEKRTDK